MNGPKPLKSQPVIPSLELIRDGRVARVYEITETDLHIGRTRGSEIQLEDTKVSRNHARVERQSDGSCYLVDLESQNHTYLDDRKLMPFEPVRLRDGCRIKVFDHELIFRDPTVGLRKDEEERSTVLGSIDDLSSIRLARRLAQPTEAIKAILDVNRALGGTDLNDVFGRVLDGLMAVFSRAERGFILTVEPDGTLPLRAVRHRGGPNETPSLSRTIARQVLEEGKAVLISDATVDADYRAQQSVSLSLRSALVVPLPGSDGKPAGMVQLDRRSNAEGFTSPELDLLAALAVPMGIAIENHSLLKRRASWAAAGQIQRALLPKKRPDVAGYAFWECYRPVEEVGGDLYDYIPIGSSVTQAGEASRWAVVLGDVAGHGMPAALMMAGICPEVRHLVRAGVAPDEVLTKANQQVFNAEFDCRFVTLVLTELDSRSNRLIFANAGHPPPLIRRRDSTIVEVSEEESGTPLGIDVSRAYGSITVALEPGDVVVLYSDGVTDARDRHDEPFGGHRLREALAQAPQGVAAVGEAILATVHDHASGRSQFDDITLVCFGRNAE
jgi:sigma-B regulation protein RsbU (phosphoserine phosphatase)